MMSHRMLHALMLYTLIILLIFLDSLRRMTQTVVFRKNHSESGALKIKKSNLYIYRVELRMDLLSNLYRSTNHSESLPKHAIHGHCLHWKGFPQCTPKWFADIGWCESPGKQMWCLGDLNHFQVHRDSDFTCVPYFRSLPQSQSRAQSLSEGASHNHPHNTKRSAQFTEVIEVLSIISGLEPMSAPSQGVHIYMCGLQVI